jgi:hypothetical protein
MAEGNPVLAKPRRHLPNHCVYLFLVVAALTRSKDPVSLLRVELANALEGSVLWAIARIVLFRVGNALRMEPGERLAGMPDARRTSRKRACAVHTDLLENAARWRAVRRFPCREADALPTAQRRSSAKWEDARSRLSSLVCARSITMRTTTKLIVGALVT